MTVELPSFLSRASPAGYFELSTFGALLDRHFVGDAPTLGAVPRAARALTGALTKAHIAELEQLDRLEALHLLEDPSDELLASVAALPRLRLLEIQNFRRVFQGKGRTAVLARARSLSGLVLLDSAAEDADLEPLERLSMLSVEHTPKVGLQSIEGLHALRALRLGTTWFPGGEFTSRITDDLLASVSKLPLRYLSILNAPRLSAEGVGLLSALDLEVLHCGGSWGKFSRVAPNGRAFSDLIQNQKNLRELHVVSGMPPASVIGALAGSEKLDTLVLPCDAKTLPALEKVAVGARWRRLALHVWGVGVAERTFAMVNSLVGLEQLQLAFADESAAAVDPLATSFAAAHPSCAVRAWGTPSSR